MDITDKKLLNLIQEAFPLDTRPYRAIGFKIGMPEHEVFHRLENLKKQRIIRRLGGIFDSAKLGYVSTLCAARVPADKVTPITEHIQNITEITHCYLRNHDYNLWFTVIACSHQRMEQIINTIKYLLGNKDVYSLPAKKVFKVKVCLNLLEQEQKEAMASDGYRKRSPTSPVNAGITEADKALIRLLQEDLPHTLTPFSTIAKELNLAEENVLARIDLFLECGILRRLGAVLYHQQAGFTSNAMGVWRVPTSLVSEAGRKMAGYNEVSHCYERPGLPMFSYNLYTMVHGHSDQECHDVMAKLSEETGLTDYLLLFSQTEFKKSSMRYFVDFS
ncbi:AsnC family transcriptional regulator [Dehalobacter sp. DCM]|uniref:siroheme decarboxylase subunit beta n=1 Tax=Dehalobacter sp. DCM TaxID=2907827 RepID=UPI0030812912|nr:AsnC family transcriptional regulator [Dehalobacter sp. DCM]